MAQNNSSDQNQSVADLEAEIAASRDRLARNIDEIVFRAQPKQIVKSQKEQLVDTLKAKYAGLMGTSQKESYAPAGTSTTTGGPSKVEEIKAKASAKAEELKAQASAKADELKAQASDKLPGRSGDSTPAHTETFGGTTTFGDTTRPVSVVDADRPADNGGDLATQARVKADQARLKLDELTHTEDGELRTDRVATALAAAGALLVTIGAARRAGA